jgi:branched-chain amino acid transport system substrate-binding protein
MMNRKRGCRRLSGASRRMPTVALALAAASALAVSACSSGSSASSGSPGSGSQTSKDPYSIGATVDLSGPTSSVGIPMGAGIRAAVAQVNATGGVAGHKVNLNVLDNADAASTGIQAVQTLISKYNVSAILGLNDSDVVTAIAPVVANAKVPTIADGIPTSLLSPPQPYLYTNDAASGVQGIAEAEEVTQLVKLGDIPAHPTVAAVYLATPSGQAWLAGARSQASKEGFTISASEAVPEGTSDYTDQATHLAAAHPDVIVGFLAGPFMSGLISALKSVGLSSKTWILGHTAASAPGFLKTLPWPNYAGLAEYVNSGSGSGYQGAQAGAKLIGVSAEEEGFMIGYTMGIITFNGLQACGYPCSGEQLQKVLNNTKTDVDGLAVSPVEFSSSFHGGATGGVFVRWDSATSSLANVGSPVSFSG